MEHTHLLLIMSISSLAVATAHLWLLVRAGMRMPNPVRLVVFAAVLFMSMHSLSSMLQYAGLHFHILDWADAACGIFYVFAIVPGVSRYYKDLV